MKKKILSLILAFMLAIIPAVTAAAATGEIEYMKATYIEAGSTKTSTDEAWFNPKTNDFRSDYALDTSNKNYTSNYVLKNGTKIVNITRNSKGKAISGTYTMKDAKFAKDWVEGMKASSFASIKAEYQSSNWKKIGTVKENGKTLTKLSGSAKKIDNFIQYAYIDSDTGLPVKVENYSIKNKKKELTATSLYEYKQVSDKGIFDTSSVKLKKVS